MFLLLYRYRVTSILYFNTFPFVNESVIFVCFNILLNVVDLEMNFITLFLPIFLETILSLY